ncbi:MULTISPECIES: amidohydrolase family protein [unclassified Mycolicibacterium]|uniref:amidohydrolase family protein n=1 Tax=unclassified Mycolicibacterium TaxID=2636767 RepID=UPI002EDBA0DA
MRPATEPGAAPVELVIRDAQLLCCFDDAGTELRGGWLAVDGGIITSLGAAGTPAPEARNVLDASGCVVLPGLVNAHQHLYQNLTRAFAPAEQVENLTDWFWTYFTAWARLDADAVAASTTVGLAELALSGCTTSADHLYLHPEPELIDSSIRAAAEVGLRFHPVRGSMTLGEADGGVCPSVLVEDLDAVLADTTRLLESYHDPAPASFVRIGVGPSTLMSSSATAMIESAAFADAHDVRLHSHVADDPDEDRFVQSRYRRRPLEVYEDLGWFTDRTWFAHVVYPNDAEIAGLAAAGVSVAHCPSMTMIDGGLPGGPPPIRRMLDAGVNVGIGCDGATAADHQSLWLETRTAMLLSRQREGRATAMSARDALRMATRGGARALGREGEIGQLTVGANADISVWRVDTLPYAGVLNDPITGLMQCGPTWAWHTIVGGRFVVRAGELVTVHVPRALEHHRRASERVQRGD